MSTSPDFSLPPYPNEPLYLQSNQAYAAKTTSFFWSLLALLGPNYWFRPVESTNRARVVRLYHFPEREVDLHLQLLSPSAPSFVDTHKASRIIPEVWLLEIELPSGARLIAETTKDYYQRYKDNQDQPISVDYQVGRFDGVPKLHPVARSISTPPPPQRL